MGLKGSRKPKNPPFLSNEFIIQNHADIVSCVAMVFVIGLMFQVTASYAAVFVTLSHNASAYEDMDRDNPIMLYTNGWKDLGTIFFYSLIAIVIHAVIQEYILDKITRKLRLSKTKLAKFNESGQLLAFTGVCAAWGVHIIHRDGILSGISSLWTDYPKSHAEMTFAHKAFFITQIAYWIHCFPELYFQKVKREDMFKKVTYPIIMLSLALAAYILNFTRIALILLVLRYFEECIMHSCRLIYFAEKLSPANTGFRIWNVLFVVSRLVSFIATILTFHYGLATLQNQGVNYATGNFNSPLIRFNALLAVCLSQAYMMWTFTHFHIKRSRERQAQIEAKRKIQETKQKAKQKQDAKAKQAKKKEEDDLKLLPEADQNTRRRRKD